MTMEGFKHSRQARQGMSKNNQSYTRCGPTKFKDITGKKFGRWTAQWPAGIRGRIIYWLCLCICGRMGVIRANSLATGNSKSCGCLQTERRIKHGHAGRHSPEYNSWLTMIQRCTNPINTNYKYYGARGIKVCRRWKNFENFLADMGPRPDGKSLDRWPDNNGDYKPGNVRWATSKEQQNNLRPRRAK